MPACTSRSKRAGTSPPRAISPPQASTSTMLPVTLRSRRNGAAFKRRHVVAVVAAPQPRNGDLLVDANLPSTTIGLTILKCLASVGPPSLPTGLHISIGAMPGCQKKMVLRSCSSQSVRKPGPVPSSQIHQAADGAIHIAFNRNRAPSVPSRETARYGHWPSMFGMLGPALNRQSRPGSPLPSAPAWPGSSANSWANRPALTSRIGSFRSRTRSTSLRTASSGIACTRSINCGRLSGCICDAQGSSEIETDRPRDR